MIGEFNTTVSPGEKPKIDPIQEERNEVKSCRQFDRDLKEKKGEKGLKIIRSKMKDETVSDRQVNRKIESMANIEEARKIALEKLKELGFIETKKEGDREYLICDVDKMKEEMGWKIAKALGPAYYQKHLGDEKVLETIAMVFHGIKSVSKDDYEKGIRVEHDLIYSPQNKNDALNVEKIRQSKFHFLASDLFQSTRDYAKMRYGNIPTVEEDKKNGLDFREVVLPVLIYHPDYGDGYKDDNGRIFVRDDKTREFRRLTSEYIKRRWGVFGPHISGENFASPKLFIKKRLIHLAESGLLPAENFTVRMDQRNRQMTDRPSPKIKTTVGSTARITIGGVEHLIGSEYLNEKYQAYQLSKDQGGIIDENGNIIATFNIFSKDDKFSRTPKGSRRAYYQVKKSEVAPRVFHKEKLFSPRLNESLENYQKRIDEIASFQEILKMSDALLVEENIRAWEELSIKEQFLAATLYGKIGKERFMEFVHEYQLDGLRACVALESGFEAEEMLFKIAEQKKKDSKFSARLVFRKYNKIVREKENIWKFIRQSILTQEVDQKKLEGITYNFEIRSRKILEDFSVKVGKLGVDEVEGELEKIRKSMIFLGSTLIYFKEQGLKLTPEMIRGMKMESHDAGELAGEKKEKFRGEYEKAVMDMMRKSYAKIFEKNPDAQAKVEKNFLERFENLEKYRVYVLTFEFDGVEEAVAFSAIDPASKDCEEGEVMSESTVVHPETQKGSLGIAFLKKIFETEFEKYAVLAIRGKVRAGHPAGTSYDAIGLKKDESRPNFLEKGVEYEWRVAKSSS